MSRHLFISDLHLTEDRPETTAAFQALMNGPAQGAQSLFILGDLFEYWAGDDDLESALALEVAAQLQCCARAGTQIHFIAGNRDFLLGADYARRAGMALQPDPFAIELDGVRLLLSHGDALCTDDVGYQAFRAQVREPHWRAAFLARPLPERKAMIEQVQRHSQAAKQEKSAEIMDVNADAVAALFRAHDYPVLIHGHTHRPAHHQHSIDGKSCQRWVLADWDDHAHYLVLEDGQLTALNLPSAPTN